MFNINENIDLDKIKNDLDKLDLHEQEKILKKFKDFVIKNQEELNKKRKMNRDESIYQKNKKFIDYIRSNVRDNSILKKLFNKYDFKGLDNISFLHRYGENIIRRPMKSIQMFINGDKSGGNIYETLRLTFINNITKECIIVFDIANYFQKDMTTKVGIVVRPYDVFNNKYKKSNNTIIYDLYRRYDGNFYSIEEFDNILGGLYQNLKRYEQLKIVKKYNI